MEGRVVQARTTPRLYAFTFKRERTNQPVRHGGPECGRQLQIDAADAIDDGTSEISVGWQGEPCLDEVADLTRLADG